MRRKRSSSRWVLVALFLIIVGLAVLAAWAGSTYSQARACVDSAAAHARALEEMEAGGVAGITAESLIPAGDHLRGLQQDLRCLRRESRPLLPLARLLGWLPRVGPDVAAAPDLLDMGQALADGGVLALDALSPLLAANADLPAIVTGLQQSRPALDAAQATLAEGARVRQGLDAQRLSPRLARLVTIVDRALPLLESGVEAARLAPELLGTQGARTYLLLAQNDDERRPTGGWISGAGLVRVDGGRVEMLGFRDSFSIDNLAVPHDQPPDSLFRALWAEIWLFRDANWSPDFPSAAQTAELILQRDQSIVVDGVIAVDQEGLRQLVTAMEPLTLPSSAEPVTGQSLLPLLRSRWAEPQPGVTAPSDWSEWEAHRKDIMPELSQALIARVQAGQDGVEPVRLAGAAWRALEERHILVTAHNAEAAALLADRHWDGGLLPFEGDYLQVVDANVGFNKVDPNVQRSIDYRVDLGLPDRPRSNVTVHYENRSPAQVGPCMQRVRWVGSYQERMAGCYWNYVRFYVPQGAELVESGREPLPPGSLLADFQFTALGDAGPAEEPVEKDLVPVGLFFVVAPGQARDVRLEYTLPGDIVEQVQEGSHYRLLVQKQSGTAAIPLRVTVSLPPGAHLVRAAPEPAAVQDGVLTFDLLLDEDRHVDVVWR